jgi:hypothetical protein
MTVVKPWWAGALRVLSVVVRDVEVTAGPISDAAFWELVSSLLPARLAQAGFYNPSEIAAFLNRAVAGLANDEQVG